MSRRVGILGGTFDPIHCGHVDLAAAAERALALTDIDVVTSHIPPHRPAPIASGYHRFAMVALAVAGRSGWRASDFELQRETASYTAGTLAHFHERGFAPAELFFAIGADAFAEIVTWYDYPRILDAAHFAVVSRPGFPVAALPGRLPQHASRMAREPFADAPPGRTLIFLIDAPTTDVAATAIRRRLAEGESIAGLVPPAVQQHIEQHRLYVTDSNVARAHESREAPAADRLHGQN